jgi:hypothetical protein
VKTCPALSTSAVNAAFPTTNAGVQAVGTCIAGYAGSASRQCNLDATWGTASSTCVRTCSHHGHTRGRPGHARLTPSVSLFPNAAITCPALPSDGNAAWPVSNAGTTTVSGTCGVGYTGTPSRACDITGNWGAISSQCTQISCPALSSFQNAAFPSVTAGAVSTGACVSGYTGTASRQCNSDGTWGTATVTCTSTCSRWETGRGRGECG